MNLNIKKCSGFQGEIFVPGDKSISHRAAFIGAMARGETRIENFLFSGDCLSTLFCLRNLGVEFVRRKNNIVEIGGKDLFLFHESSAVLMAGNSGTTARLLMGLVAGQDFFSVIEGDPSLKKRPMKRVAEPLERMGARIIGRCKGNVLPMAVNGASLNPIVYKLPVPSGQLKSAVILAALLADGESRITEPVSCRDHTERLLKFFGADISREGNVIHVQGRKRLEEGRITIPGDISSAAFLLTAAVLSEKSKVILPNVGVNPTRTGFLDILGKMGAKIEISEEKITGGEPAATLTAFAGDLEGVELEAKDIPSMIDEVPLLALVGALARGRTVVRGASELRIKESDRIGAVVRNLRKMGAEIEEREDGFMVEGPQKLRGAVVDSEGDHRIAMCLAVAGLSAEGETIVRDFECCGISYPGFTDVLKRWEYGH
ncbi:MAG: 3-phosphoshikimate 1-carboxyvinyltransferase [Candidatus Aminicenantes bacterium]|nr:3-phosphoshikimate 1-carboxyvinyltransferase [Candidatus Aminicenantes bacterium]